MVAANKNYVDIVDALLEGGADPNIAQQVIVAWLNSINSINDMSTCLT